MKNQDTLDTGEIRGCFERRDIPVNAIAKKVIRDLGIPIIESESELEPDEIGEAYQTVCRRVGNEIVVIVNVDGPITRAVVKFCLLDLVSATLNDVESFLENSEVQRLLSIENDKCIRVAKRVTYSIIAQYLFHGPLVFYHSFIEVIAETLIGLSTKYFDKRLKGLGRGDQMELTIDLFPNRDLREIVENFPDVRFGPLLDVDHIHRLLSKHRRDSLRNRTAWLDDHERSALKEKYATLRRRYQETKKIYNGRLSNFLKISRRSYKSDFDLIWKRSCFREFPDLFYADKVSDHAPMELAHRQLGLFYGLAEESIRDIMRGKRKKRSTRKKDTL